jgi:hypothetical protein
MAVYKTRWFERWARKQGLTTPSLCVAVREMKVDCDAQNQISDT